MKESKERPKEEESPTSPVYLEVSCQSTGKVRRFAAGTEASFALSLMNNNMEAGAPPPRALFIKAVKSGEEPIYFGPTSPLVNYGHGWTLQTHVSQPLNGGPKKQASEPGFSFVYVGKIAVAFLFIFLLGGIFTLALESLPKLLLYINSSL